MKKLIGCPAGEWAKKLFTLDRFEKLVYFLDECEGEYGYTGLKKHVYAYEHLKNENLKDIVVIINDTRKYDEIKDQLEKYGLIENKHFFNGWKLDSSFYKEKLPQLDVDLYYLAGVIDYIENMPQFIKQLKNARYVILSKVRNERFIRLDDKIMDKGYMNYGISAYYVSDLITDMFENEFVCKKMEWNYRERDEYYFLFIKNT